jgi:hypothetical protein
MTNLVVLAFKILAVIAALVLIYWLFSLTPNPGLFLGIFIIIAFVLWAAKYSSLTGFEAMAGIFIVFFLFPVAVYIAVYAVDKRKTESFQDSVPNHPIPIAFSKG